MHAALIHFMSIPPVLLMKYAKTNVRSRFYIFIIPKTRFSRKGAFSQSLVFLCLWKIAIGARFCLCRTEKERAMRAPAVVCKCRWIGSVKFGKQRCAEVGAPYGNTSRLYLAIRRICKTVQNNAKSRQVFTSARHSQVPSVSAEQTSCATLSCRACVDETICVAVRYL